MKLKDIVRFAAASFSAMVVSMGALAQDYAVPLDVQPFQTSSGFGKLRGTRFHAGLDLRTGGVEGKKVYAIEDGYIYRIGVKPYGYGNVLYVQHPDGRVSLYAHLSKFNDDVAQYVRSERYRLKQNSVDLFPAKGKFPVKKGDVIALSGNTGSSTGPHLHFEIRERGDWSANMMSRGYYKIKDDIAPQMFNLYYYTVDTLQGVPVHTRVAKAPLVRGEGDSYKLSGAMQLPGKGYFVIETMDRKNDVNGSMATYRITLRADGKPVFEYVMDGLTYAQNHWAKIIADYNLNRASNNDAFRLAVINDGAMPFYRSVVNRGIIDPSQTKEITIEAADDNGNVSTLSFPVSYAPPAIQPTLSVPANSEAVYPVTNYTRTTDGLKVTIPSGSLYEPLFYTQSRVAVAPQVKKSSGTTVLTDYYNVHRDNTPLRAPVTLSFRADVPAGLQDKVVLARVTGNGRLAAAPAKYSGGNVTGHVSIFGVWTVATDTTKPAITPLFKSGADMSNAKFVSFRISDDFSGLASFYAEVDGAWVLLEHNTVKGVVYHYFDDALSGKGKDHTITVTAKDAVGNVSEYKGTYCR